MIRIIGYVKESARVYRLNHPCPR